MKKRFLLTSALMLLLTVLALTSATYAWFTMSTTNTLNEFTVQVRDAQGGLEISLDGARFSDTNISLGNPALKALDVTSPDGETFYTAELQEGSLNQETQIVKKLTQTEKANEDYLQFDLYFRTSNPGTIQLNVEESYIRPASLTAAQTTAVDMYDDEDVKTNQSALGDFTRDWIAAATRLSIDTVSYQASTADTWQASATAVTKDPIIFEPLKTVRLSKNSINNKWSLAGNGTVQDIYKTKVVEGNTVLDTTVVGENEDLGVANAANVNLVSLGATGSDIVVNNNPIYIVKMTLRVWIEGQDSEARVPLAGGLFDTQLVFNFVQGAIDANRYVDITNVAYANGYITWDQIPSGVTEIAIIKRTGDAAPYTYTLVDTDATTEGQQNLAATASYFATTTAGTYLVAFKLADGYAFDADLTTVEIDSVKYYGRVVVVG